MSKVLKLAIMVSLVFAFLSCDDSVQSDDSADNGTTFEEQREKADAEFFSLVGDSFELPEGAVLELPEGAVAEEEVYLDEMNTPESVSSRIKRLSYDAYVKKDDSELVRYLRDRGLYDQYVAIMDKYGLNNSFAEEQQNRAMMYSPPPQDTNARPWLWNLQSGDIVLSHDWRTLFAYVVPGRWQHAGIVDTRGWGNRSDLRVLSATAVQESNPGVPYGDPAAACVGYESLYFYNAVQEIGVYRVSGVSSSSILRGIDSVKIFNGRPYNILSSKDDDSSWYCSKIVYRAYRAIGRNVEKPSGFYYELRNWRWVKVFWWDPWVSPDELADDDDTYFIAGNKR